MPPPQARLVREDSPLLEQCSFGARRSPLRVLAQVVAAVLVAAAVALAIVKLGQRRELVQLPCIRSYDPFCMRSRAFWMTFTPEPVAIGATSIVVAAPLVVVAAPWLLRAARRLSASRGRRRRWDLTRTLDGAPEGQDVVVRGHVLPGPGFTSAGGREGVVLASYLGTVGDLRGGALGPTRLWELHGVDFALALGGGEEVRVRVERASLRLGPLDFPARLLARQPVAVRPLGPGRDSAVVAAVYDEQVVAPGDVVEVFGVLRREVDPTMEAGSRTPRLRNTLVSTPSRRVLIHSRPLHAAMTSTSGFPPGAHPT
jgi:hypothetical protein